MAAENLAKPDVADAGTKRCELEQLSRERVVQDC
jgi:hypothetical protein